MWKGLQTKKKVSKREHAGHDSQHENVKFKRQKMAVQLKKPKIKLKTKAK